MATLQERATNSHFADSYNSYMYAAKEQHDLDVEDFCNWLDINAWRFRELEEDDREGLEKILNLLKEDLVL